MSSTCEEYMNVSSEEEADDPLNEESIGSTSAAHDPLNEEADATSSQDPLNEEADTTSSTCSSAMPPFKSTSEHSISSKYNKRKIASLMLQETNVKLDKLIRCLKESNEFMYKQLNPEPKEREYTKKEIYEELCRIGVPSDRIVHAYITLGQSKEKTELFFSTPEDMRLEILNELVSG